MTIAPAAIVIRDIERIEELRETEELQKTVWGVEDREVVPALAMIPMLEVGAILIGAFAEGKLVGFAFGFPGHEEGCLILHSDMLAVVPAYRSYGLGYQLKLAQRERALASGIDTITWTYDPLQALNANLNFRKLGVTSDRYRVNYYGETSSFLHSTGTDRLWVRWELSSERVEQRIEGNEIEGDVNPDSDDIPFLLRVESDDEPSEETVELACQMFLEIPADINSIQKEDPELAVNWRMKTREAFGRALDGGLYVDDFRIVEQKQKRIGRYLLTAKSDFSTWSLADLTPLA
jgi:predicted GNAT superfamily acetyltransferase